MTFNFVHEKMLGRISRTTDFVQFFLLKCNNWLATPLVPQPVLSYCFFSPLSLLYWRGVVIFEGSGQLFDDAS